MESENKPAWIKTAGLRMVIVLGLIAVVTPFWVFLVFFTELPLIVLAGIALIILLLLSTATAWSAIAIPDGRNNSDVPESDRDPPDPHP